MRIFSLGDASLSETGFAFAETLLSERLLWHYEDGTHSIVKPFPRSIARHFRRWQWFHLDLFLVFGLTCQAEAKPDRPGTCSINLLSRSLQKTSFIEFSDLIPVRPLATRFVIMSLFARYS